MKRIGEPIRFVQSSKADSSDSSYFSEGEIFEVQSTLAFMAFYFELSNSHKVSDSKYIYI